MKASLKGDTEVVMCLIQAKASPDLQAKGNFVSILNYVNAFSTMSPSGLRFISFSS